MIDLRLGNVLDVLAQMPSESVHCIVTSPPYWGLRAYGTEPQVWRNGSEPCPDGHMIQGDNTCTRCGAWRGELGLEPTPELFVEHIVAVMREARRVLRADGTLWLNIGDSYAARLRQYGERYAGELSRNSKGVLKDIKRELPVGLKEKDLVGIPWRVAFALQADGWTLRSDIIWHKPNPMPESVRDRPTKAHEYLFLLAKQPRYYYDADAVREPHTEPWRGKGEPDSLGKSKRFAQDDMARPFTSRNDRGVRLYNPAGRNRRSVWTVTTHPYSGAHFATFPPKLIEPCILAATSERGVCSKCGAPWVRVVEKSGGMDREREFCPKDKLANGIAGRGTKSSGLRRPGWREDLPPQINTLGWRASCACDAGDPVPATVLDPFNGAGTTGLVALQHGRRYIGIDLKQEYLDMTRARLAKAQLVMVTA